MPSADDHPFARSIAHRRPPGAERHAHAIRVCAASPVGQDAVVPSQRLPAHRRRQSEQLRSAAAARRCSTPLLHGADVRRRLPVSSWTFCRTAGGTWCGSRSAWTTTSINPAVRAAPQVVQRRRLWFNAVLRTSPTTPTTVNVFVSSAGAACAIGSSPQNVRAVAWLTIVTGRVRLRRGEVATRTSGMPGAE